MSKTATACSPNEAVELVRALYRDAKSIPIRIYDPKSGAETIERLGFEELEKLSSLIERAEASGGVASLLAPDDGEARWVCGYAPALDGAPVVSLAPSLALVRDGEAFCLWVLEDPADIDGAIEELCERGRCDPTTPAPLPGSARWRLAAFEPERVYSYDELNTWLCPLNEFGLEPLEHPKGGIVAGAGFEVICDLGRADNQPLLNVSEFTNTKSRKGRAHALTLAELMERLCVFRRAAKKDGPAYVFAQLVDNVRQASAVTAVSAMSLDFDDGISLERIDEALAASGLVSVRYTTFSHAKTYTDVPRAAWRAFEPDLDDEARAVAYLREKKRFIEDVAATGDVAGPARTTEGPMIRLTHAPLARCRVVFPLLEAFCPDEHADDPKAASAKFSAMVAGLARKLRLEDHYDVAAVDLARLNYLPAVRKDAEFHARVFNGACLDWRKLEADLAVEEAKARAAPERAHRSKAAPADKPAKGKGPRTASTEAGKALGRWQSLAAERFQLARAVRDHAGDHVRVDGGEKVNLRCPFDADHSNPGDEEDTGFFVSDAAPGRNVAPLYVASCRHTSCAEHNGPDMVAKLLDEGMLPAEALFDRAYFLGGENMDALCSAALPALSLDKRLSILETRMDNLAKNPERSELDPFFCLMAVSDLSKADEDRLLDRLWNTKKVKIKGARAEVSAIKCRLDKRDGADFLDQLVHPDGTPFELPAGNTRLARHDGRLWIEEYVGESWMPRTTPFQVVMDAVLIDDDNLHQVQVGVHDPRDGWTYVYLTPNQVTDRRELAAKLQAKGMRPWDDTGVKFAHIMVRRNTGRRLDVVSRAGFRTPPKSKQRIFVLPTGEFVPSSEELALAKGRRIKPGAGGAVEDWTKAANALFEMDEPGPLKTVLLSSFVGPLLSLTGAPTIVISMEGESSTGKTTSSEIIAATWGAPKCDEGLYMSAYSTLNATFERMVTGSGTAVVLDEIAMLKPHEQQTLVMQAQAGQDKARKKNAQEMDVLSRWEPMVLYIAAENGFANRMRTGGLEVLGGMTARLFPVCYKADRIVPHHRLPDIADLRAVSGVAGPAFVRALYDQGWVDAPESLDREVEARLDARMKDAGPLMRRSARLLAYIETAADIAREGGLFNAGDVTGLLDEAWGEVMLNGLAARRPVERAAETLLHQLVHEHGRSITSFDTRDVPEGYGERVGYHSAWYGGRNKEMGLYVLRISQLDTLYRGVNADPEDVVRELGSAGKLMKPTPDRADAAREWVWRGFDDLTSNEAYVVVPPDVI